MLHPTTRRELTLAMHPVPPPQYGADQPPDMMRPSPPPVKCWCWQTMS